jgi:hypothetical protein
MLIRGDRLKLSIGCAATAALALGGWLVAPKLRHPPTHADGGAARTLPQHRPEDARSRGGTSNAETAIKGRPPATVSYKAALESSHDYWDYASRTLSAAQAGDRDAQFYLSRALERCQSDLRMYLQKGRPLTEEESLQWAAKRHLPLELAQQAYERCHRFQEDGTGEFGNATEWLGRATLAGQPVAQATTATRILLQRTVDGLAKAGAVPVAPLPIAPDTVGLAPRELFRQAVESRDPEALLQISEADALLHPSTGDDDNTERFSWLLVACQEGLDCSPNADWVRNTCYLDPQCASASSASELIEHLAGAEWPAVQQRAQELKAKLDADEWDDLGLGGKG